MAGERGLHGHVGGFLVADLADHHHVRVLTQDGAQAAGEGHVDLGVDLGLADAFEVVLNGILDGEDVARTVVEGRQRGIERGGLARTGGAGDQDDAVGLLHRLLQLAAVLLVHAEMTQGQTSGLLVQQAQHHPLAVGRGQRGNADVHLATADPQRDTPVLRDALLGDVQLGHDLDPRDQQRRQLALGLHHFAEDAVDAKAYHQPLLEGFDMDIRGVLGNRLAEDRVDQTNDRRVVLLLQQVLGFLDLVGQAGQVEVVAQPLDHQHRRR